MKEFVAVLEQSLADGTFVKLSLAGYTGDEADLKSIHVRRILVKREEKLSFTYRYKTRDIVKNYDGAEGVRKIVDSLRGFREGTLCTTAFDIDLSGKKKAPRHTEAPDMAHDRGKNRHVATAGKAYLHALGITDAKGEVYKNAQDKFRQIDKFVEIMSGLVKDLPRRDTLKIVDMGAGKGYLTFALYDYLTAQGARADVTGIERRADLVRACNGIAHDAGFGNLKFAEGTIENYDAAGVNVLIALHACDTATDDAIAKGIKAGADLIVVAPCCHKQVRREMEKSHVANALDFLTKYGIFLERHAEMVTDGLRGLFLEYAGYKVKIFEFIGGEHTPKNVMIVAVKDGTPGKAAIMKKIEEKKKYFGVGEFYLETALGDAAFDTPNSTF